MLEANHICYVVYHIADGTDGVVFAFFAFSFPGGHGQTDGTAQGDTEADTFEEVCIVVHGFLPCGVVSFV